MSGFNPVSGMVFQGQGVTTLASAATWQLPGEIIGPFEITGSATVTSLTLPSGIVQGGRIVTFYGGASAAVVFTNTNDTTTAGQMDLGGANITIADQDVLMLMMKNNGTWIRVFNTNN